MLTTKILERTMDTLLFMQQLEMAILKYFSLLVSMLKTRILKITAELLLTTKPLFMVILEYAISS
jgi:hypothetical protein